MKITLGFVFAASVLSTGCSVQGEPIDFSKVCSVENDAKTIEVKGVLTERGSLFCSNTGGRMECGFDLLESAGSANKLRVDIEQGSGSNTVDKVERGYRKEDIKIRDNTGNEVKLDTDLIKATGKVSVAPDGSVCFMQLRKIER